MSRNVFIGMAIVALVVASGRTIGVEGASVPGIVVDHSPAECGRYIGSPSLAVLPNGDYVASHDFFGPGSQYKKKAVSSLFRSSDRGVTWDHLTDLQGQFWSSPFFHDDALYILGTDRQYGNVVIRRSTDGGETWSEPKGPQSGRLTFDGGYHTAPVPVTVHDGRLWRGMEDNHAGGGWGEHFRAFVMSAPKSANLLDAANWRFSNRLDYASRWPRQGWLEGNVVATPDGGLVNILRVAFKGDEKAAIVNVADDGQSIAFDRDSGLIDFYGGRAKFTVRFDPKTERYWSLVNKMMDPEAYRNRLVLVSSKNLRHWRVESLLLSHPDSEHHAFQYIDWLFEGSYIIAVSRTAWDGSHNAHDANYMTFASVSGFPFGADGDLIVGPLSRGR